MNLTLSTQRRLLAQLGLALVILIPVGLWFGSQPLTVWLTLPGLLRSVGHLCGVVGATLFSCNFILSARIGWIEEIVNGLPKVYALHHLLGGLAFILLLVHPVFLGLQYLPYSVSAAASFFWPNLQDIPKLLGIAALTTLTILLLITFFIRIAYHNWKTTHQWLGLALFLASLHVYLIPGHLEAAPWLRGYMVGLMSAGLVGFAYRVILGRWLVRRYPYIVDLVTVHDDLATEVRLMPQSMPITYQAGQFFFAQVYTSDGVTREAHPFSFTSNPHEPTISFAAKMVGDYTATLPRLKKGMRVDVEGPYGRFGLARGGVNQVWIAGGIGITPFMSRVRELPRDFTGKIHLYYVVRSRKQILFAPELKAAAQKVAGLDLDIWESDVQGRFMAEHIDEVGLPQVSYFVCGPSGMMADLKQQLKGQGVHSPHIITEDFASY